MASQCWNAGRIEAAVGYADAGQMVIASGRHDEVPYGIEGVLGAVYLAIGQPERWVEWCRAQLARGRDTHGHHQGRPGLRTDDRRFAVRRRWPPRTA